MQYHDENTHFSQSTKEAATCGSTLTLWWVGGTKVKCDLYFFNFSVIRTKRDFPMPDLVELTTCTQELYVHVCVRKC